MLLDPLIACLFRLRTFSAAILVNVPAMFAMVGFALFTTLRIRGGCVEYAPMYRRLVEHAAPLSVGVAATVSAMLARKIRPALIIAGGLLITALGYVVMLQVGVDSALAVVLIGATLQAAGIGVALTLTSDLILSAVSPERAGAASALSETSNELGGALGIAVLGSIGAAVYRRDVAGAVPADAPVAAVGAARQTLGGAQTAAGRLPEHIGAALLHTAREAFVQGMHAAALTGAAVMVVAAGVAIVLLRQVEVDSQSDRQDQPEIVVPSAR